MRTGPLGQSIEIKIVPSLEKAASSVSLQVSLASTHRDYQLTALEMRAVLYRAVGSGGLSHRGHSQLHPPVLGAFLRQLIAVSRLLSVGKKVK